LQGHFPERCALLPTFSHELAHWIEAGADFFMMPSEFEPCGLNQLYSMAYGTVPVVRATGGLRDTVVPLNSAMDNADQATGLVFNNMTAQSCGHALWRARRLFVEFPDLFRQMQINGMHIRMTWASAAQEYLKVYDDALTGPRPQWPE
jgi:starch synthase